MKIAVILFRSLGDVVISSSIVHALKQKYSDSQITFITEKQNVHILEGNPDITEVVVYNNYFDANLYCAKNKFDKVIRLNMANSIENAWHHIPSTSNQHLSMFYAKKAGLENFDDTNYYVYLNEKDIKAVDRVWNNLMPVDKPAKSVIVIHTSSGSHWGVNSRVESKDWPIEKFNELAEKLFVMGYVVAQVGSFDDKKLQNKNVIDLTGKLTFKQHLELFKRCEMFVGTDSGLAYLAKSSGVKSLVILGATSNSESLNSGPGVGPIGINYIAPIRPEKQECSNGGCFTNCLLQMRNIQAHNCISTISLEQVLNKIKEILNIQTSKDKYFKANSVQLKNIIDENTKELRNTFAPILENNLGYTVLVDNSDKVN